MKWLIAITLLATGLFVIVSSNKPAEVKLDNNYHTECIEFMESVYGVRSRATIVDESEKDSFGDKTIFVRIDIIAERKPIYDTCFVRNGLANNISSL